MKTLILFLLASGLAFSQSGSGRAALEGHVSDASGRVLTGARVAARETSTGFVREAVSDGEGQFRIGALPVGAYRIEVSSQGFGTGVIENVPLTVGNTKTVDVTLQVAALSTQVTVETNADIVNRSDPANSVSIDSRAIEDLPIRGRNFTEFVQLAPNVTQEGSRFGIVVNGQRSINSNISIDGVDFNDPLQGGPRGGGPKESAFFLPAACRARVPDGAERSVGRGGADEFGLSQRRHQIRHE